MSEKPDKLTFAAIGDLHVKEDRTLSFRELFAELSTKAKVLVLCGDLTDLGKPSEAELLAEDLRACSVPTRGKSYVGGSKPLEIHFFVSSRIW
jgi:Icc-related predicted phosphoesterase